MAQRVHFIPVGFDFERLVYPISKGGLEADRVVIIDQEPEKGNHERAAQLAGSMVERVRESFELFDIEVENRNLSHEELYDYEELYPIAYNCMTEELRNGNEVFVNISSMPRTVAFAFATAANSIITEQSEEYRNLVHTYYVAPERYLVLDLLDELDETVDVLEDVVRESDTELSNRLEKLSELRSQIDRNGVTRGARELDSGNLYVEFPAAPSRKLQDFEGKILKFLFKNGPTSSTSQLAEDLASDQGVEYDESFRSRVQYNVSQLDTRGFIEREMVGNRYETELSTMGKMWIETHQEEI